MAMQACAAHAAGIAIFEMVDRCSRLFSGTSVSSTQP
jgi:hypothetical protein